MLEPDVTAYILYTILECSAEFDGNFEVVISTTYLLVGNGDFCCIFSQIFQNNLQSESWNKKLKKNPDQLLIVHIFILPKK